MCKDICPFVVAVLISFTVYMQDGCTAQGLLGVCTILFRSTKYLWTFCAPHLHHLKVDGGLWLERRADYFKIFLSFTPLDFNAQAETTSVWGLENYYII